MNSILYILPTSQHFTLNSSLNYAYNGHKKKEHGKLQKLSAQITSSILKSALQRELKALNSHVVMIFSICYCEARTCMR